MPHDALGAPPPWLSARAPDPLQVEWTIGNRSIRPHPSCRPGRRAPDVASRRRPATRAEALRPEAERLVEALWRPKNDPAGVVAALRADRALSEPLHQAALRAVLRRAQPPDAAAGNPPDLP